ncbi:MAG: hypothetical protein QM811_00965 [Pirellulales bacterium]
MKACIALLFLSALGCTATNGKPNVTLNLNVQIAPVLPTSNQTGNIGSIVD